MQISIADITSAFPDYRVAFVVAEGLTIAPERPPELDALMRDEICELSDAIVAVADNVPSAHDQRALAEASMIVDFQRSVLAYADVVVSSLTKVFSGASNVMGGR